jgi:NitT/TauT family transport system substrate-binding protein
MTLARYLQAAALPMLILAACGGPMAPASVAPKPAASGSLQPDVSSSASAAPSKPGQIVTAYAEVVGANSGVWGAKEAGLFQKRGLEVDMRLIESSLSVGALISGQVQFAVVGGPESFAAAVEGADLRVLATLSPVYPYKFEANPSMKTTDDLKGKKVGISRFGSSSDIATRVGLRKVGLDADKDVTIVQVGSLQARMTALATGAIDGGLAGVPDNIPLEDKGFHVLFDLAELELPAAIVCIVVQGPWLATHRDETQRYIDAMVETIARLKRDKGFAQEVIRKYVKLDEQRLLDASYDYTIAKVLPAVPYVKPEGFKDSIEVLSQKNPKARDYDLNKLIDNSFLKSAAERGLDR